MPSSATAAPSSFEIKSAQLTLVAFLLKTADIARVELELSEQAKLNPGFFNDDPVVVDLSHLDSPSGPVDFARLIRALRRCPLLPVAVRGGPPELIAAARAAGLADGSDSQVLTARGETIREVVREVIREVPVEVPALAGPTMLIDKPLRSGQQVYARGGDLIITAVVNHGAEVIADGSIHIYAPLRGKAIAGAKGLTQARIFALHMEPELLAIAGTYRTGEQPLPDDIAGQAAQVRFENDRLVFERIPLGAPKH